MKNILTILSLLLLMPFCGHTQEWAPVGAKWYYGTYGWWPYGNVSYTTIEVAGEAEVNGISVKVLEGSCDCAAPPKYTYEEQGRVYLYVEALEAFRLYYDFNLSTGDTLYTFDDAYMQEVPVLIESVSYIEWNGFPRKVQHIRYLDDDWHEWGNRIIEGVGSDRCLNFIYPTCDPVGAWIRCFESPNEGVWVLDPDIPSCTFTPVAEAEASSAGWKAYPNPASGTVTIEWTPPLAEAVALRVLNHLGQILEERQMPAHSEHAALDVNHLEPGLYFLEARMAGKTTEVKKFLKR